MPRVVRSLLLALAALPAVVSAQVTSVTGRVVDRSSRQPLPDAQVVVVGTRLGARVAADGNYRIVLPNAGTIQLRAMRIGYASETQAVTAVAGQATTADFALATSAVRLDAVVTTATGDVQRRRESGASVAKVQVDSLPLAPIQNFSQLVSGRGAGVTVQQSTGTTGMGARVRIRGANSLSLSNEPLLIIDGVRIDNSATSLSSGTLNGAQTGIGGQSTSALNEISTEDIESLEIIKGPAASSLYGTAAANGVIQITTKRGTSGKTQWSVYGETGRIEDRNDYPANYGLWTTGPADEVPYVVPGAVSGGQEGIVTAATCNLVFILQGACTADSMSVFNPFRQHDFFRTGTRGKGGLSVSGGIPAATYFISGDAEKEKGIYPTNELNRYNARVNVNAKPRSDLDVGISSSFIHSALELPQNDNNYVGIISDCIAGWPQDTDTQGCNPIGPKEIYQVHDQQTVNKLIGGVNSTYRPLNWLSFTGVFGIDLDNRHDEETLPPLAIPLSIFDYEKGWRESNRTQTSNYTSNLSARLVFDPTPSINSQTQFGFQYKRSSYEATGGFGKGLVAGTGSLGGVTTAFFPNERTVDDRTRGLFVSEQLSFRDRIFLTGALRGDKNNAFGADFGTALYPSVGLSWVISEEPFFPSGRFVNSLRLRSAFGQSGLQPGARDAIAFFYPVTARQGGQDVPAITTGQLANEKLKPERVQEAEVGADLGLFDGRVNFEATYYNKRSRDALVWQIVPPSVGGPDTSLVNLGAVSNQGVELLLNTRLVNRRPFSWNATVTFSGNKNNLRSLRGAQSDTVLISADQRHVVGHPLGGYWGKTVESFTTTTLPDGTVVVDPESIVLSDVHFLGNSTPTRQASISTDATFFGWLRVSTLFEHQGGHKLDNATEEFRCALSWICRPLVDPSTSLQDQANAFAVFTLGEPEGAFVQDASFWKWREVSVTLIGTPRMAGWLRASNVSLTIAGRNLHTWSDYGGLDPEVSWNGQQNFYRSDFLTQPQIRRYTVRLNLNY